jgi:hypothetical protein
MLLSFDIKCFIIVCESCIIDVNSFNLNLNLRNFDNRFIYEAFDDICFEVKNVLHSISENIPLIYVLCFKKNAYLFYKKLSELFND